MSSRVPEFKNKAIILGVPVNDRPMNFFVEKIDNALIKNKQLRLYTPNPEICLKAEKNENYLHVLERADFNLPDGIGLKLGAKILGEKLKNRVTGADLTRRLLEKYQYQKIKIFIVLRHNSLTGKSDLKKMFQEKYPQINFQAEKLNPEDLNNCDNLLNKINNFQPDIIFTTLGAPEQEIWIDKYLSWLPKTKIALAVGGSFDFLTGQIKRAPKALSKSGLEWLYRFYQEPKRLKRVKNATVDFLLTCHRWKERMNKKYRQNAVAVVKNQNNKFLIIKNPRFKNHWQFPQGGIELGEKPEKGVIRELSEEVGASKKLFKIIKKIPEQHRYDWPDYAKKIKGYKGQKQSAYLIQYLGTNRQMDLKKSFEAEKIKWVKKQDLKKLIHHHRQELLKKILTHI